MRLIIEPNYQQLSCWAASYVAKKINEFKPTEVRIFPNWNIYTRTKLVI